jgi:hypothetical protein
MTPEEQKEFLKATGIYIREQVAKAVADELREFRFLGTWQEGHVYKRHNSVQYAGSTWVCMAESTTVRPSTDEPLSWGLCAKRGRDGKNAYTAT